jgi:hypothetical protein
MARIVMHPQAYAKMDIVCERVVEQVTDAVHLDVLQAAPIGADHLYIGPERRHGGPALITTIHSTFIGDKSGQVWVGTGHWQYPEYGTSPHTIRPHGPYQLRDRLRGKKFGFKVNHPGSREQAFMRKSLYQKRRLRYVGRGL